MDLDAMQRWVDAVESANSHGVTRSTAVDHQLDLLAEHLVGLQDPQARGLKQHIQEVLEHAAPDRPADERVYLERYGSEHRS